jgi:hypothetical protein
MDAAMCVEALDEAICRRGAPQILNTDQGFPDHKPNYWGYYSDVGMPAKMMFRKCSPRA